MADLEVIEQLLCIDTDNKRLRNGKRKPNKNQYFYYKHNYYIVKLTKDKWIVCSDNDNTRKLLRIYTWWFHPTGYAKTHIGNSTKSWHQLYLSYQSPNICDHINNKRFDNRSQNFRIVNQKENTRNRSKPKNNTSCKQGVFRCVKGRRAYWWAQINDISGKQIQKLYSIAKLGEDEAKQKAIQKRKEWERLYNYIGD